MLAKLYKLTALLMVATLLLAACAPKATPTPVETTAAPVETVPPSPAPMFKACQVTDTGGIDDKSFNATAWKGVQDAMAELGVEGKYLESQQQTDYEKNINAFIEDGCDIIITVGFLLGDATKAMAEANPEQKFSIVDFAYDPPIPNVLGQVFNTQEAAFLAGYLAAGLTKTGVVGTFGGIQIPPVTVFMDGFALGVEYYNQQKGTNVQVKGWDPYSQTGLFTGNFESTDDGRTMGESLMDEGADIILPVAGPVGLGTAAAAMERGNVYIIGVDADWYYTAPEYTSIILTSILKNMDVTTFQAIKAAMEGTFEGGVIVGTLENGGVGLAPFHDLESMVPPELVAELEDIKAKIIAGEIQTLPAPKPTEEVTDIGTAEHPIKVLFVPSVDAAEIIAGGEILAATLKEATGLEFEVSVPTSYAATIEEMCASPTDTIGFIPGLGYVLANQLCGVDVAAKAIRFGYDWYAAMVVVQRDSDIQSLEDLDGKKWAYPDPGSTSGYLYPLYMFQQAGITPGETLEAGGHTGVIRAVYNGEADFGTAFYSPPIVDGVPIEWEPGDPPDVPDELLESCAPTADGKTIMCGNFEPRDARRNLRQEAPDVIQKLRILAVTPKIPNDTLSFGPEFPASLRQQIMDALFAFAENDPEGFAEAMAAYDWTGISPAADEEYDPIRQAVEAAGFTLEDLGE